MQYEDYLNHVWDRLLRDKFTLEKVQVADFSLDLFGISPVHDMPIMPYFDGIDPLLGAGPYWLTFALISVPFASISTLESYSKTVYDYAFNKVTKHRFFHRIILPAVASNGFHDEVKSFVLAYKGDKLRYPTVDAIRPVLIDLESDLIYYNSRVTIKYSRTKKIAKEAVEKYLIVNGMKKM